MEFKNHRSGNSNREKEIDFSETAVFFSSVLALKFPEKRKKKVLHLFTRLNLSG